MAFAVRRVSAAVAPLTGSIARASTCAIRTAMPMRAFTGARFNSTEAGATAEVHYTNPKNVAPEYLMKFKSYHTVKHVVHLTSYFLAVGVPLTLLVSNTPLDTLSHMLDWGMTFAIPAHFHVGMRTVFLDYAHFWFKPAGQALLYKVLAAVTVLSFLGLVKFNATDVGITKAVTMLFQDQPKEKKAGAAQHH